MALLMKWLLQNQVQVMRETKRKRKWISLTRERLVRSRKLMTNKRMMMMKRTRRRCLMSKTRTSNQLKINSTARAVT